MIEEKPRRALRRRFTYWWLAYGLILFVTAIAAGTAFALSAELCADGCVDTQSIDSTTSLVPRLIHAATRGILLAIGTTVAGAIPVMGLISAAIVVALTRGLSQLGSRAQATAQIAIVAFLAAAVSFGPIPAEWRPWAVWVPAFLTFVLGSVVANSIEPSRSLTDSRQV